MSLEPRIQRAIRFGQDFELDANAYELRRSGRALKLERIPMEVLLLLVEKRGQLVSREQIVERIWGRDVFLDTDNSINGAIRKLRQALRDDPEKPRVVQTVTGKGYRFIADVAERDRDKPADIPPISPDVSQASLLVSNSADQAENAEAKVDRVESPAIPRRWQRRWPVLLGVALMLVAGTAIFLERSRATRRPAGERVTLAVLPFENLTGDPAQEYFSDGLTEEMISRLGNLAPHHLAVVARTSVMHYKNAPSTLTQIGRELRVEYVLEGSVRRDGNRVRIAAQLNQVSDQTHLWARQYDRELSSLLAVQEEIAQAVADEIQLTLASGSRVDPRRPTLLSPAAYEAYDLYLKGRSSWNKRTLEGFEDAVKDFQQAADKDPTYARAYAGLADSWALMSSYDYGVPKELVPKARSAALRALELDDRLAEAHTSLALIIQNYDWDWSAAESEYRRAIQLDPNYATAHHWYAEFLSFQGRFEEALSQSEEARRLDPLSAIIAADHAAILYFAREYDRSIDEFRRVLDKEPTLGRAHMVLWVYAQKGMFSQALAEMEKWRPASDAWSWSFQAWLYGRMGRQAEARRALEKLEQWARDRSLDAAPMLPVAYLGAGEREKALASLEELFRERSNLVVTLKVDPVFDPLREDSRFQALLRSADLSR